MKRVMPFFLVLMLILVPCAAWALPTHSLQVLAEEPEELYAVADKRDVWFYSAENEESGLFLMPYTYYVKILRRGTVYCAVQYLDDAAPYKSVTGYCKTDDLTFVDFIPERPYLRREITITYNVESAGGTLMGKGAFSKLEKTFVYYGTSYLGTARFFYVYADGVFDYVPATQEILYDLNTDYLTPAAGEEPADTEVPSEGLSGMQILIVCVAAVALAAIAVFVLRGKKPTPAPQELPEF